MNKEILPAPNFDFNPKGQSPFDMIISGGFDFTVPSPERTKTPLVDPAPTVSEKLKSPINVISLEERINLKKNRVQPQRMTKREWLVQEIKNNATSITNLNEAAFYAAKRQEMACAPGDGHGIQASPSVSIESGLKISKSNSLPGAKHESGKHDHCSHGNDYGECPDGCKKAA